MALPEQIYTAAAVRRIERDAIASGTAGYTLMQRAGAAALEVLKSHWPQARSIVVVAGPGNNGGDGLVMARLATAQNISAHAMLIGEAGALRGEAALALQDLSAAGLEVHPFDAVRLSDCDVVIDALLGIGVRAPLLPQWTDAIDAMNSSGKPVLSLDLPSGLHPDTGESLPAVRASATISFLAMKQGLLLPGGKDQSGVLSFDDLGVKPGSEVPSMMRIDDRCLASALAPRRRDSHKSLFGHVLIVGGGEGMPGAVRLTAEAALRVGAGLVTVASRPEHLAAVVGPRPELMFHGVAEAQDIDAQLRVADVIAVGPGLGRSEWACALLDRVLSQRTDGQRLVVDADALNLMASGIGTQRCDDWVLTPHPGEAARMLGTDTGRVQQDRLAALSTLCDKRGGTVILKGSGTLIGTRGVVPRICNLGNPGMAVPGMGDVLTGAVAGILAQGAPPFEAAVAAVYAHACAGDLCARRGLRGILASDVAAALSAVLAELP